MAARCAACQNRLNFQPPEVSLTLFVQGHYEGNRPALQMTDVDSSA